MKQNLAEKVSNRHFVRLRIAAILKLMPRHFTQQHVKWILGLARDELDAHIAAKKCTSKTLAASPSFEEFGVGRLLGAVAVPRRYSHNTHLDSMAQEYAEVPSLFSRHLIDRNFAAGTSALVRGRAFNVFAFEIKKATSARHCLEFLQSKKAILVGPYGLDLVSKQLQGALPIGRDILSFDDLHKQHLDKHRIPVMTIHKVGKPAFRLTSGSGVRAVGNILICFTKPS